MNAGDQLLVPPSPTMLAWADWYLRRYLARHFHAVRIHRSSGAPAASGPVVVYLNHASWWDPVVALVLTRHTFPDRTFFGPMEAAALARYGILRRLGFFPVERGSFLALRKFLRHCAAALARPDGGLCLTPQGHFADVRARPIRFEAGLGEVARRTPGATFIPLAIEYPFWEERTPEVLVKLGEPVAGGSLAGKSSAECLALLEAQLAAAQDSLAHDSIARRVENFDALQRGRTGIGGVYDLWRAWRARVRGERFVTCHSEL